MGEYFFLALGFFAIGGLVLFTIELVGRNAPESTMEERPPTVDRLRPVAAGRLYLN